jgi:hypothetical protein
LPPLVIVPIGGGERDRSGITNMVLLDDEIQFFLRDLGKTTMSLPPMEKESRKRVHELADCYSLKSASKGAGRKRFTTLIKTSRSGLNPNRAKIGRILRLESSSYFAQASWSAKSGSGNHTMPGTRGGGAGKDLAKRREGEVVGEGAKMLGQDNLGHKLLSKMGWTEGTRIGKSEDGLAVPWVTLHIRRLARSLPAPIALELPLTSSAPLLRQCHGHRQELQIWPGPRLIGARRVSSAFDRWPLDASFPVPSSPVASASPFACLPFPVTRVVRSTRASSSWPRRLPGASAGAI